MLFAKNLVKVYNGKLAVSDLNIKVEAGEIYGFLGPNGAGKSTTINMILGLIPRTGGEVVLCGQNIEQGAAGIKRRLGVVGEIQHFYGEMTGYEYLSFFADFYGVVEKKHRITELLEKVNLENARNLLLRNYSKGMQQKMAFARALVHDPDLLILDEPVSSLDPYGIKQVRDIILEENQKGKTVFISSHLLSEIEKTCHRIGIINRGVMMAEDTMESLKKKLSTGMELEIELEAIPQPETVNTLRALPFVNYLTVNNGSIIIRTQGEGDHRGTISKIFMNNGCVVISMVQKEMTLEDAFVTITEKNISLLTKEVRIA